MAAIGVLGSHGLDDSIRAYVVASAAFLAGFAFAPLSKRFLGKGDSSVNPG
jgi:hypothetical protein